MYFQAFRGSERSPLDPELVYIVEQLVSQLLATTEVSALKSALQEKQQLADMLVDELSCLGQIPRVHLPQVREYLIKQEPTLTESARRLVREPDNEVLRQELCTPQTMTVA